MMIDIDDSQLSNDEHKAVVKEYVKFIKECGFKPIKVIAKRTPFTHMRVIVEYNTADKYRRGERRKYTTFFEARIYSGFSLQQFKHDVMDNTKNPDLIEDFKKALKIRIGQGGFTDEEIISTILPYAPGLRIDDVWVDGKVVYNDSIRDWLFDRMNYMGGPDTKPSA